MSVIGPRPLVVEYLPYYTNSSQNSIYTDSSKYNHVAARSGRAAYLLPSPYHLTNIFVWKVVCQFQLEHPLRYWRKRKKQVVCR